MHRNMIGAKTKTASAAVSPNRSLMTIKRLPLEPSVSCAS
jgi:hypothetical protein